MYNEDMHQWKFLLLVKSQENMDDVFICTVRFRKDNMKINVSIFIHRAFHFQIYGIVVIFDNVASATCF